MTSNPLKPIDDSASRTGNASGSQSQSNQQPNTKNTQGQSATSRDAGARSFRSVPETGASSATRGGGSSDVLSCLDSIDEFVAKARKALSASGRDGASQGTERQSNEAGSRSSNTEDDEQGSDRQGSARQGSDRPGNRNNPSQI